jgi:hypothetical protein
MNRINILKVRMERLGLAKPVETESEYDELFSRLQPVSTEYFSEPGQPPSLRYRAAFDDIEYNRLIRQNQDIVKARFQGNTISYVLRNELELYAAAFAKPVSRMDDISLELLTVLEQVGPMDKSQLIEELDIKGPVVTKILQKFQKAFLVYELQPDRFGEQVWQAFSSEWPEFDLDKIDRDAARGEVILRFIRNMVTASAQMVKDWSRFSNKDTRDVIGWLADRELVRLIEYGDTEFYYVPEDKDVIHNLSTVRNPHSVFVIHKADYICRSYESVLKEKYKGREILQFLLIDGEFAGAVEGHWRIGPHNVEDVIIELPDNEAESRKGEIIAAVSAIYHPPYSRIMKYNGEAV